MDESDAVTKGYVGSMHREAYVTFNEGHITIPETWNGVSIGHDTKQSATECLHPLPFGLKKYTTDKKLGFSTISPCHLALIPSGNLFTLNPRGGSESARPTYVFQSEVYMWPLSLLSLFLLWIVRSCYLLFKMYL